VFALRLNTPIVFAGVSRLPDGRFKFSFEPVEVSRTGVLDTDVDGIVAAYTSKLERFVRTVPGQYMWQHRRWKHSPPADTLEQ
jgi:lauroyl/myristoyl acyltransferase